MNQEQLAKDAKLKRCECSGELETLNRIWHVLNSLGYSGDMVESVECLANDARRPATDLRANEIAVPMETAKGLLVIAKPKGPGGIAVVDRLRSIIYEAGGMDFPDEVVVPKELAEEL